ncbi:hypothetical protein VPNG_03140 [Cytospora leucostoma]|uniref:Uncharacterized protein n=1 Tax=Cytospora leucostoma TaxID=1230097 RepID=A0A423XF20_9PEZI|nr:hypothetical protein VPNG_03140 [Cytospora leucostoma]
MPSFSPYKLSAHFAKTAVGHLNRVWTGRVSKEASRQDRSRSPRTVSSVVTRPIPTPLPPHPQPDDSDYTRNRNQSNGSLAIKQEDYDDSPASVHGSQVVVEEGRRDEDESSETSFANSIPIPQDEVVAPDHLDGRDRLIQSIEDYDENVFGVDAAASLRGGNHVHEDSDGAEGQQDNSLHDYDEGYDDDVDVEEESETQINMDDYYESDDDFEDEFDVNSEVVAWYRLERTRVENIATWPREIARAHKCIALRGLYSLMPTSWAWDLIDHPFVEGLFAPASDGKKLILREHSNQFRATRALRDLFELHIRVCAYRQDGLHDQIAHLVEKAIRNYGLSIEKDVKLRGYYDYVSPVHIIKVCKHRSMFRGERNKLEAWLNQQALQSCQARMEQYHSDWADRGVDSYPRFLYTFVIIQQTVLVWAIDTDVEGLPEPYVLASLDMSERTAWLETSLAIAITLHLAKDSIYAHSHGYPIVKEDRDDPDA